MPLRRLLNVAYAALAYGKEDDALEELDRDLEAEPSAGGRRRRGKKSDGADVRALMAMASLPQVGVN